MMAGERDAMSNDIAFQPLVDVNDNETVQSCVSPSVGDSIEQWEVEFEEYLERMVYLHMDRQELYDLGLVGSMDFMPESIDDVYHAHLYCMSWFYEDVFPFENLEEDHDRLLAERLEFDILEWELAEYL